MKKFLAVLLMVAWVLMLATSDREGQAKSLRHGQQPPSSSSQGGLRRAHKAFPNQYIVSLKDADEDLDITATADELAQRFDGVVLHYYQHAIKGFAVQMSERKALALSRHPLVEVVEEDGENEPLAAFQTPAVIYTYQNPTWNLDRIDQRDLPLSQSYSWTRDGRGVHVYVIDTGIRTDHVEFGNRATADANLINDGLQGWECSWHGTAMASVIGGVNYGVAKRAWLHSVRALRCGATPGHGGDLP
jgi:subtilisin family serine protease